MLVAAIATVGPGKVLWVWPLLYCAIQGIAFMYYWPTLLALVSRAAPAKINATMMGVCFLTLFVANNLIGWIGTYLRTDDADAVLGVHAAIGAAGGPADGRASAQAGAESWNLARPGTEPQIVRRSNDDRCRSHSRL